MKWDSLRPSDPLPTPARVILAADASNTGYNDSADYIFINDSTDQGPFWSEAFNKSTMCHEYGHRIAYLLDFMDNGGGSHKITDLLPPDTAAYEGWAQFYSALVRNSPVDVTYWNNFTDSSWANWETGVYGVNATQKGSVNALGYMNEGAIAGIWWDIIDADNDDQSGIIDWGDSTLPHHPDSVSDTLCEDVSYILKALLDRQVNGHRPDDLHDFWEAWFSPADADLGHCNAMYDIFYEHGDTTMPPPKHSCCCVLRGDMNHDGVGPDIADLCTFTSYLFQSGPDLPCSEEADINGSGSEPDIADLIYLVEHMFQPPHPAPVPCD